MPFLSDTTDTLVGLVCDLFWRCPQIAFESPAKPEEYTIAARTFPLMSPDLRHIPGLPRAFSLPPPILISPCAIAIDAHRAKDRP